MSQEDSEYSGEEDPVTSFKAKIESANEEELDEIESDLIASIPKEIKPNSPNEYIYGCLTGQTSSLNACVPSCINGHHPKDMKKCNIAVYEKKNDKITKINTMDSSKSYLYVSQSDDEELTKEEISKLRKKGVNELYIYKQRHDSLDYEHVETKVIKRQKKHTKKKKRTIDWGSGSVIALVILFVLIIFIMLLYRYMKSD